MSGRFAHFDSFTLDFRQRALYQNGERIRLTGKPLETLIVLVTRAGETVTKRDLLDVVWKDVHVTEDVLVQAIGEIRRALGQRKGDDRFVQTVPRQGYRFVMPMTLQESEPAVPADENQGASRGRLQYWPALVLMSVIAAVATTAWVTMRRPAGSNMASASEAAGASGVAMVQLVAVSTYGTIHAGGIVVEVDGDANRNTEAALEWRSSSEEFRPAHVLVRVDDRHFVGSLFGLDASTTYELRVTLADPDGVTGRGAAVATMQTDPDEWPRASLSTLHVSPSGQDTNTGESITAAVRTIQRAADLARPGDVVLIHPGVYRETVRVRTSGTWIQPIVFRGAAPGVILDGADERIAAGVSWEALEANIYAHDPGFQTSHVTTERGRLYKYDTLNDLRALRAGSPGGFFSDRDRLYLKFADGTSPAAHTIHVGRLDRGFVAEDRSWIGFENLELRHFGGATDGVGILLRQCTSCRVVQCRIHEVRRAGIWLEGGERVRIEDNELWDTSIFAWPWHNINQSSADNHGIYVTGTSPRGLILRRNRIRGTFDAIAPCGNQPPQNGLTSETDVYDNDLSDLASDGIEAEPYCANLRLWNNRITATMMAISTAPAGPGPTWAIRNVAYRFGAARGREVWLASAFKINTFDKQATGPVFLYHNTFVSDVPSVDGIALLNPGQVAFVRARNNVIAGTRHALFSMNPIPWDGDGNSLHSSSSLPLIQWLGTPYGSLEAFRAATGQERAGFSGPPRLADPAQGDFSPASGSPLIDRGVRLPGINDRFKGRAPDVGAIEFAASSENLRQERKR
jgi:DNA-binding winged helix-turn-helix (wHTH) protein